VREVERVDGGELPNCAGEARVDGGAMKKSQAMMRDQNGHLVMNRGSGRGDDLL